MYQKEIKQSNENIDLQKSNIALIGSTGSGKTLIAQTLAKMLDVPFAISDATTLTEAGYVGEDVENILLKLLQAADFNIERAERGIIYVDEIDKIAAKGHNGGEVSREGVQRDILPIVEGSQVNTKYGVINTDHILFIASGAFHVAKPSDLMPELQGRFPIRVELQDLSKEDFERILTEPKNALLKQYKALLATENVEIVFTKEAVSKLAEIAFEVNSTMENIGARRLHTILETVLEELLFEAPSMQMGSIQITEQYVESKLNAIREDQDLTKYIL